MIQKSQTPPEVVELLARFAGTHATITSFSESLSTILRLRVTDASEDDWIVSFDGCDYIQGRTRWQIGSFGCRKEGNKMVCEDEAGKFSVHFDCCFVISEDEYWQSND